MTSTTKIEFVNHASVLVTSEDLGVLTDPWFYGRAFHESWSLQIETSEAEIARVLSKTTHIWISHEHPDHFSVPFFKKYAEILRKRNIAILFQATKDRRVVSFLRSLELDVREVPPFDKVYLGSSAYFQVFPQGFYDSALYLKMKDASILNLNDCDLNSQSDCRYIVEQIEGCDLLLTQFSYAAWKGGVRQKQWRIDAAKSKLRAVGEQVRAFSPRVIMPIASYAAFCTGENFYLNDSANGPAEVVDTLKGQDVSVHVPIPNEEVALLKLLQEEFESSCNLNDRVEFWQNARERALENVSGSPASVSLGVLQESHSVYVERIKKNNVFWFVLLCRMCSFRLIFGDLNVKILDLNVVVRVSWTKGISVISPPSFIDVSMMSSRLNFIFTNSFGFDTLTVNGCFEEDRPGGFRRLTLSLGVEALNNMGVRFSPSIVTNKALLLDFIGRLMRVEKSLRTV